MLVCAFLCAFCTRDRGCSVHPAFPAPSSGEKHQATLGRFRAARSRIYVRYQTPSLRATGSRECAPDDRLREAIHVAACRKMDCFVADAPRNDVEGAERDNQIRL